MKRLKDTFLETIQSQINFTEKTLFEVGCGDGSRTVQMAKYCKQIFAIEPDAEKVQLAIKSNAQKNITYSVGYAEQLPAGDHTFDIVIFTLSLHHVAIKKMNVALDEAIRVVKKNGYIIVFEPAFNGSFFEAEIAFDACDGDERMQKASAYAHILSHPNLKEVAELNDETVFQFDSYEDFVSSMNPSIRTADEINTFLEKHNYVLKADRRINIFQPY
ncbi:MAG: class I SAM-dependent methyltransferase [bacterium]|nr:class I SAM-dependent methyltransferase [bacterium]